MNVVRASSKVFVSTITATGLGFLGIVMFARLIGADGLGVFFLFQALVALLVVACDLGVGTGIEQRMSSSSGRRTIFGSGLAVYAVAFVPVAIGILLVADLVNAYVGAEVALLLVVGIALKQLDRAMRHGLKGELRVGETAPLLVLDRAVWVGGGVLLISQGLGAVGLIMAALLGSASSAAVGAWKVDTRPARPTLQQVRSLLHFGKYNLVPSVGMKVHSWLDVLIIGAFMTQAAVGAYEVAWQVAGITVLLATAIGTAILPQVSQWEHAGERSRIQSLLSASITPSVFFVVPAFFGSLVLAPEILELLFGQDFTIAWIALIILIAGKIPAGIQSVIGRSLLGIDKPHLVARATIYMIVLNVVLNVPLIALFGLEGAAIGTTLAYTAGMSVRVWYLSRFVRLDVPYRELSWCLLAAILMGGALMLLTTVVTVDSIRRLFGIVGLGVMIYGGIVLLSPDIRRSMQTVLGELRGSA